MWCVRSKISRTDDGHTFSDFLICGNGTACIQIQRVARLDIVARHGSIDVDEVRLHVSVIINTPRLGGGSGDCQGHQCHGHQ